MCISIHRIVDDAHEVNTREEDKDDEVRGDIYISEHIRRRNRQELDHLVKFYDAILEFKHIHVYSNLKCIEIFRTFYFDTSVYSTY